MAGLAPGDWIALPVFGSMVTNSEIRGGQVRATVIGSLAVLIWGFALPLIRIIEAQIGLLPTVGIVFTTAGVLGLTVQRIRRQPFPGKDVFRSRFLYLRWICFVLHEGLIYTAMALVRHEHIPFVILLNYLWPTATIVCSVLVAGVVITRWWAFILGSLIVLGSLSAEIVGAEGISSWLFAEPLDCLAYLVALVGAVAWGLFSAFSRRGGEESGGGSVLPFFQLTLGLALPFAFLPTVAQPWLLSGSGACLLAGYCVAQFVAFLSWDFGMRRGNVVVLSLFADFIPWISLAAAHILLGVEVGVSTVISAVALVCGAMVTRYGTLAR